MKLIKYKFLSCEINRGTEENPILEPVYLDKVTQCADANFEANLAIAQREAYNGEVTVEDIEDPVTEPTQLDQIEAQVTYTALMTDTLLEEV